MMDGMAWDYGRRGVAGSARAVCAVDEVPSFIHSLDPVGLEPLRSEQLDRVDR